MPTRGKIISFPETIKSVFLLCNTLFLLQDSNIKQLRSTGCKDRAQIHSIFVQTSAALPVFHFCSGSNPTITATQTGSAITVKAMCTHSGCRKEFVWNSQPMMPGTKILADNLLISMSTLFAGGSFTKVRTIFMHMDLASISLKTFFKHQQV